MATGAGKEGRVEVALEQERLDAVLAIGRAIGSTLDLDEVLRVLMDHTTRLMRAERSTLFLVDRDREEIWSKVVQGEGLREIRSPLTKGIAGWVCLNNRAVIIPDAAKDPRFNPEIDKSTGYRTRSMVVAPMRDVTGVVIGAVQVLNRRGGAFGREDESLLTAIAAQAGVAVENARLYRDVLQRNRELDLFYEVERQISSANTLEELLQGILKKAMAVMGVEAASVLLVEEESGQLFFKSALGERGDQLKAVRLALGEGIAGEVARTGEPIVANDAPAHPAFNGRIAKRVGFAPRQVLCAPIAADGKTVGALELLNHVGGRPFESSDLRTATLLAGGVARAISVRRGREEGERKARLAAIGQMISGMLHDLRTPMAIISGYAQMMAEEADKAERARLSEVILKQFDQISAMARETLAFARGESDILLRKVYLDKFVAEVGEYLAKDLEGQGIVLEIKPGFRGTVRMDEVKIKRAIYNIARNAAQAMPDGGRFSITLEKEGDRVVFGFADTGVGIPEEIADKVFESFVSRKVGGTGLGLAIVKKVVEQHGGEVNFTSKPGKGTTFVLKIPA